MINYSDIFEKAFQDFGVPSISAAIYDRGEIGYYNYGIADDRNGLPPTEHTRYMIGSTSKSFVAAAINILAEEGRLSLDDRVLDILPDFRFFSEEMDKHVTVRKILSHQTGLPRHDGSWVNNFQLTLQEMVHNIRYLEPAYAVSERFHYQNHMYALASLIIEKVSGMPWTEFVSRRILEPLKMEDTLVGTASFGCDSSFARPYMKQNGKNVPCPIWPSDNMGGAANIISTAADTLKWMVCNLHKGEDIFGQTADRELHSVQMPIREYEMYPYPMGDLDISSSGYGMGWFIEQFRGVTLITHGGTVMGFKSACGYLPEHDFAFAIFSDLERTQSVNAAQFAAVTRRLGLEEKDYTGMVNAAQKKAEERSQEQLDALLKSITGVYSDPAAVGEYAHPAYGKVKVTCDNGDLRFRMIGFSMVVRETAMGIKLVDATEAAGMIVPMQPVVEDGKIVALDIMIEPEIKHYVRFTRMD